MVIARILMFLGLALVVVGGLLYLLARAGLPLGRLPGDIRIQTGSVTIFFPLATMILLSVVLTVILNLAVRFLTKVTIRRQLSALNTEYWLEHLRLRLLPAPRMHRPDAGRADATHPGCWYWTGRRAGWSMPPSGRWGAS